MTFKLALAAMLLATSQAANTAAGVSSRLMIHVSRKQTEGEGGH